MNRQNKHTPDNRGVSLLEVIVAVAIFSIAAIVLMQGFVTSGRINRKSNLYLEATTVAQNVMEEIKAKDFEHTALAFNYPLDPTRSEGGYCRFHFLEQEAQYGEINSGNGITIRERTVNDAGEFMNVKSLENGGTKGDPLSATVLSEDGGKTFTFNPRQRGTNTSKYYFEMLNVTNKHETFDVQVTFDGSKDVNYKKKDILSEDEKNDYESPNIAKLDNKKNGFLIMNKVWDETALINMIETQWQAACAKWNAAKTEWEQDPEHMEVKDADGNIIKGAEPYTVPEPVRLNKEDVYEHMKRSLTVTLSENGGIVTAKAYYRLCAYDYEKITSDTPFASFKICPCGGSGENSVSAINDCFCTYTSVETAFYSSEADVDLKNIYLFYYPNYSSSDRVEPLDKIEFVNLINYPVNLYVVKQKTKEIADMNELSQKENSYRVRLVIKEDPYGNDNSNWFTNLNLYRAQTKLMTNLNTDISVDSVSERKQVKQMTLEYKDASDKKVSDTSAENILSANGLDNREQKDSIFKVSVKVYKAGAAEKGFPEDELVAFLDGSKED